MKLASSAQMRELDRKAVEERGIPSIELMERAAESVAETVLEILPVRPGRARVCALCGPGNNGGDGIAAARILFLKGVRVRVFLVGDEKKLTKDAAEEICRLSECGVGLEAFDPEDGAQASWIESCHAVIDAVFGVGLSREVAAGTEFAAAIDRINRSRGKVVSADIASGVEADTGRVLGCAVKADRTIAFTLPKIGQFVGDGALHAGDVCVRGIGIPAGLERETVCRIQTVERDFVQAALPSRKPGGHKGDFGRLLVVGGSVGFTGAPYLTASAAVRSGCGLVYLGVPETVWEIEAVRCVSAMPFPLADRGGMLARRALPALLERLERCDALALGPGLGRSEQTAQLVRDVLCETEKPVVLDADGINALEGHIDTLDGRRGRVTILTPHDAEFARIGGDLSGGRVDPARAFAQEHGCFLVLKGHRTITAAPSGNVLVNTTGNSGLAKGGSGDVLTGMIASLLAQGASAVQAAAGGVWIHGRAGDLAARRFTEYCMAPEDVIAALPETFREIKGQEAF